MLRHRNHAATGGYRIFKLDEIKSDLALVVCLAYYFFRQIERKDHVSFIVYCSSMPARMQVNSGR